MTPGQQHDAGIDDVAHASLAAECARRLRLLTIERLDMQDARAEEARQAGFDATSGRADPTQIAVPSIASTSLVYDRFGRLESRTQGAFSQGTQTLPRTWQTAYDANGYIGSTTEGRVRV